MKTETKVVLVYGIAVTCVIAGVVISSHLPWPPGAQEVEDYFNEYGDALSAIIEQMKLDNIDILSDSVVHGVVGLVPLVGAEPIDFEKYRPLFERAGSGTGRIYLDFRLSEEYDEVSFVDYYDRAKWYLVSFFQRGVPASAVECHPSFRMLPYGDCYIPMEGEWYAHFHWMFT